MSSTPTLPALGDFATHSVGTDSYAVEVIDHERNGRTIVTRSAAVIAAGALPGDDEFMGVERGTYTVLPNEDGQIVRFTLRTDGAYRSNGRDRLVLGRVNVYRDPNF